MLTQLTFDEDRCSQLQWLTVAIAILSKHTEEVSFTVDQVGNPAGQAVDGGGHQLPGGLLVVLALLHDVVGDNGAARILGSLPADDHRVLQQSLQDDGSLWDVRLVCNYRNKRQ